jgi:hypothetical protein
MVCRPIVEACRIYGTMSDPIPPTPTANKIGPIVQACIAAALLGMFAGVLFLPAFIPSFHIDADIRQTLYTLVTAVVFFFIGKNTDSASHEATISDVALKVNVPPVPPIPAVRQARSTDPKPPETPT